MKHGDVPLGRFIRRITAGSDDARQRDHDCREGAASTTRLLHFDPFWALSRAEPRLDVRCSFASWPTPTHPGEHAAPGVVSETVVQRRWRRATQAPMTCAPALSLRDAQMNLKAFICAPSFGSKPNRLRRSLIKPRALDSLERCSARSRTALRSSHGSTAWLRSEFMALRRGRRRDAASAAARRDSRI